MGVNMNTDIQTLFGFHLTSQMHGPRKDLRKLEGSSAALWTVWCVVWVKGFFGKEKVYILLLLLVYITYTSHFNLNCAPKRFEK
jgi:hypothetical protein